MSELAKTDAHTLRLQHVGSPTALYFRDDPLMIVRGEKQYLIDENGKRYLDCINNVAHVGHSHPVVTKAFLTQMSQLCTNSRFLHPSNSRLAQRLTSTFPDPLNVCFSANSGSEANELALTLASSYTGGTEIITQEGAYHGHLKACHEISPYKWNFPNDKKDHVHVVSAPNVYRGKFAESANPGLDYAEEVKTEVERIHSKGKKLSAFILESLQCCGGQIITPSGYMRETFRHVRNAGGVCIADEVQVGFGRVGSHFWAFQLQGPDVIPDIVTIGKPMGNGHPISAVVTTKKIADSLTKAMTSYFNTFGGNSVSCTVANAVLDIIETENLMESAASVGAYALKKLMNLKTKHEIIGDVRGVGLFIGVELVKNRKTKEPATKETEILYKRGVGLFIGVELVKNRKTKEPATKETEILYKRLRDRYILVSIEKNVMLFKPPMCFSCDNIDQLVEGMDDVLSQLQ